MLFNRSQNKDPHLTIIMIKFYKAFISPESYSGKKIALGSRGCVRMSETHKAKPNIIRFMSAFQFYFP